MITAEHYNEHLDWEQSESIMHFVYFTSFSKPTHASEIFFSENSSTVLEGI